MDALGIIILCAVVLIGINIWKRLKLRKKPSLFKERHPSEMHKYTITLVLECDLPGDEPGVDDSRRVLSLVKDILEKYEHTRFEVIEGRIRNQ
jgi:hypothetical protein